MSLVNNKGRGFRPDVEGLRAVAILAVLLCHAGVPFAAGGYVGVDVFFVISGFLITRLLVTELDRSGTVSLLGFYARRARRLLPLLLVVLVAVVILSALLLSPVQNRAVSGDVASSALYVANWHFAAESVDYFAQGAEPSPVQHLWSLAIEEQFYFVWPALLLAVTWLWRRRGFSVVPVLWGTVVTVLLVSLLLGVHLTAEQPEAAYFSTLGRAWELALGAMLALPVRGLRLRLSSPIAAVLGWAGLGAIVYAILAFDSATAFPGLAALVPTLGAACLIAAGTASGGPGTVSGALSLAPVRYVGRISYAWYLWHWPALVFAIVLWDPLTVPLGLAVVAAAWVPTAITHRLVEEPVRLSGFLARRPYRSLALGLGCTVTALLAASFLINSQPTLHTAPVAEVEGARALDQQPTPQRRAVAVRPNPLWAGKDRSQMYEDGCLAGMKQTESDRCLYGDRGAKRTMFLFGDSHAMQYFPAVAQLAKKRGWRLVALAKAECTPATVTVRSETTGRKYGECDAWREKALRRIESRPGAIVIVSSASDYRPLDGDGNEIGGTDRIDALRDGYRQTLRRVGRAGLRAAVIKDPPAATSDVPSCVSAKLDQLDACAFRRVRNEADEFDARAVAEEPGAHLIDLTDRICPRDLCRAVIGDALVYRDKSHLSATFARTLAPDLERGMKEAGLV